MTEEIFACKVVNKTLLVKPHQRDKMAQVGKMSTDDDASFYTRCLLLILFIFVGNTWKTHVKQIHSDYTQLRYKQL